MASARWQSNLAFALPRFLLHLIIHFGFLHSRFSRAAVITRLPDLAERDQNTICAYRVNPKELRSWCCDSGASCGINTYIAPTTVFCSPQYIQPVTAWYDYNKGPATGCRASEHCCPSSQPLVRAYVFDHWASVGFQCDIISDPFFVTVTGGTDGFSALFLTYTSPDDSMIGPKGGRTQDPHFAPPATTAAQSTEDSVTIARTNQIAETTNVSTFCTKTGSDSNPNVPAAEPTTSIQTEHQQPEPTINSYFSTYTTLAHIPVESSPTLNPSSSPSANGEPHPDGLSIGGMIGTAIGSTAGVISIIVAIRYGRIYRRDHRNREHLAHPNMASPHITFNVRDSYIYTISEPAGPQQRVAAEHAADRASEIA